MLANPDTLVQSDAYNLWIQAVWLYHVEGLTQNDVAQRLNINRMMMVRLLADAKRRNEVSLTISAPLTSLVELGWTVETRLGIDRVVVAPFHAADDDPVRVIAAAAENFISGRVESCMKVGVGWARALYHSLPFITVATPADLHVVWLLRGVAAARRFNAAEFAWQFAELFQGEGLFEPGPALGGTSLFGGKGTILGTCAGSLLNGTINNGLIIMELDVSELMMVSGGINILTVAFGKKPAS